jgi:alpha-galactosidase
MAAVLRGAGDAFILGCNHPLWASLGLVHGSRSSNDIKRTWARIAGTGRQNLERNWQNGRLWWNDPDAIVLTGDLPDGVFRFHAAVIQATGGMLLSGDDLTKISRERLDLLRALEPPTPVAARFTDERMEVGIADHGEQRYAFLLNWDETPRALAVPLPPGRHALRDAWSGEDLGRHAGVYRAAPLEGRSGRVLLVTPAR